MNKLEKFLEKYPEAFRTSIDPRYPFPMFGFECGDGWYDLLEPPIKYIHEYNLDKPEDDKIQIAQIKEKFGTLRFYTHGTNEELNKLIVEAEDKSETTCENCGALGELRGRGWVYTSCYDHARSEDR